ncbi:amidase [Bacillus sp. MRMR6]|uniref:amidase n=1 Tax=Bacillus sp. MRMR6 TaxID=1928617 RepID=UPI0009530F7F|nr:amidase [Bacillus sp. MRMR6]OLS39308.1 amidase [Bacillus sp. MRMR6]
MKKIIVLVMLFFTFVSGGAGSTVNANFTEDRATWLWNPWMIVNDELGTLAFLENKKVNKVYVQIDRDISMSVYRSFVEKSSSKGIRVYALDGAPDWVAPKGYTSQNQLMNWIGNYQNSSTAAQKFTGVHLDVEPYLYSGWTSNRTATIKSYQSLLTQAKTSALSLKLPLEVDMPFWFDEVNYKNTYGKGLLAEWVIANTNSVTIMAYRDSAEMIIDLVKNEVALSGKYNKGLVVGVETGQTSEGESISFFEEGETYMNHELEKVKNHYKAVSGFKGIAIHHVDSWMTMNPE